jgi:hypothetical protein
MNKFWEALLSMRRENQAFDFQENKTINRFFETNLSNIVILAFIARIWLMLTSSLRSSEPSYAKASVGKQVRG